MGIEFLYTVRNAFKQKWDKGRNDLCNPTLFAGQAVERRTICFALAPENSCGSGTEVVIRPAKEGLVAYNSNNERLGVCASPPADVARRIENSGAVVGQVLQNNKFSRTADIAVL